jgi:hypothetical protein
MRLSSPASRRVSSLVPGFLLAAALAGLASTHCFADPASTSFVLQPTPAAAPAGAMPVVITQVHGMVQYRDDESQPWHIAAPQDRISEGAELRTGPHSSVTCVIPPDQTFTLDRLGTVRVEEAAKHGNKITTDLLMKYGRTRYAIEAAGLEHEAKISSPSSTLAVRGTVVSLYDQPPFTPEAVSFTGRAEFTSEGNTVYVGHKHGSLTKVMAGADGASQTGVDQTVVDPQYAAARSAADSALIATQVSRGAVLSFDPIANIPVVTNSVPFTNSELPNYLPGVLDFVLRWTGNANLNLEVGVSLGNPTQQINNATFNPGEFLYPGFGLQNSPSGGHIPYDDRGGPHGGEEVAYWSKSYPSAIYGLAVASVSGTTATATLDAYLKGKLVTQIYLNSSSTAIYQSTQLTRVISPGGFFTSTVNIPQDTEVLANVPADPGSNPGITSNSVNSAITTNSKITSIASVSPSILVKSRR